MNSRNVVERNKLYFLLIFVIVTNCCWGQSYFEAGCAEYFHGDLYKSIFLLTKSIDSNQEVAKSYMYRGAAESVLVMLDKALSDLDASRRLDSTDPKLDYYYGKVYLFKGDFVRAIQYYSGAIKKNPRDAYSYGERGKAKILIDDFKGGIADEDIAISIDSTDESFYTDRGFAKSQLHQYNDAIKDFNMSIRINPNQKAFANRGFTYFLLNEHGKAITDYSGSLSINPNDGEVLYYRGLSYQAMKRTAEACSDLKKSKELGYAKADSVLLKILCK